jgi:molybdopterin synthase sulfur carrier subunit
MEVLLFGIAKDITGKSSLDLSNLKEKPNSVSELIHFMTESYPEFSKLSSLAVAVNGEYASIDVPLQSNDEIALIPPVSGG